MKLVFLIQNQRGFCLIGGSTRTLEGGLNLCLAILNTGSKKTT
jgi:hypothetical protein